ncbi:lytic transglycosylase domain-containing protein [Luteimonas sp. MC1828]|uniref:transglycosylase SLT domain-containing protein n=1 Tax=Luteimonas sp. MC1828 TaxID=2799787 RepID=UPI0018F24F50|nr:lytic transglycosylase domain-containing protein [Luteimonas sp. MC1828]
MEALACQDLAVPAEVMHHIVRVESSYNPYAIGVVGTRLARQPRNLAEAVATARQLERDGFNFSLGLAQVNFHNLAKQGLGNYELAFDPCPNLAAGSRILADCHMRAGGDWDKAFSCYYSGNFSTGFRDGYVQKIRASIARGDGNVDAVAFAQAGAPARQWKASRDKRADGGSGSLVGRRGVPALDVHGGGAQPVATAPTTPTLAPAAQTALHHTATEPFVPPVSTTATGRGSETRDDAAPAAERDTAFVF